MDKPVLGLAMCGSYCTYSQVFAALPELAARFTLVPILSEKRRRHRQPLRHGGGAPEHPGGPSVAGQPSPPSGRRSPSGRKSSWTRCSSCPARGIPWPSWPTASPTARSPWRPRPTFETAGPVIVAVSTNDGLAAAAPNLGTLLSRKHYYFVPFRQDDPLKKPCSLVADFTRLGDAVAAALEGRQLQPCFWLDKGRGIGYYGVQNIRPGGLLRRTGPEAYPWPADMTKIVKFLPGAVETPPRRFF